MAILKRYYITFDDICELIFNVMIIQSLIVVTALIFPKFRAFIRLFQFQSDVDRLLEIGESTTRGFTLSGPIFFGLAAAIVLVLLILFIYELNHRNRVVRIFALLVMPVVFSLVARTVFVFYVLAFIYVLMNLNYRTIRSIFYAMVTCLFFIVGIYTITNLIFDDLITYIEKPINFAFEMVFNLIETGELSTRSTDVLQSMYFPLELKTLLFGDWRYSDVYGGYYMQTDSGYMRNILLFGTVPLIFLFIADAILLHRISRSLSKNKHKADYKIFTVITLCLIILQYKGEIFVYVFPFNSILFLFYFFSIGVKKNDSQKSTRPWAR
ncbi:hypothetical protein [Vibrio breoganii]|uniref:hypothetical protein n=1 Tax=Vibrio breoganii TaxID=553239 RepID=UPI001055BF0E|nr:hypothetical protein [Vibrio breoganii]